MSELSFGGEEELRAFCARLLSGGVEPGDEELLAGDEALASAVADRLERCGVRLHRQGGQPPVCVVNTPDELPELALACLALCTLALGSGEGQQRRRARLTVRELWERVGERRGYTEAYVRRAGLGPLEARGLVRVVKPEQQATAAYIVSGSALSAIDRDTVERRLRTLQKAA